MRVELPLPFRRCATPAPPGDRDYGWQFISSSDGTSENGSIIALHEIVELNPSVLQIADLPVGWRAVRDTILHPWKRESF